MAYNAQAVNVCMSDVWRVCLQKNKLYVVYINNIYNKHNKYNNNKYAD